MWPIATGWKLSVRVCVCDSTTREVAEWEESLGLAGLLIVVEKYLLKTQDSMVNPLQLQFNILHIIYVRWPRRLKNAGCHLIKIPDCIHHYNLRVLPRFYIQISSKFWLASAIWGAQAVTLTWRWSFWWLGKLPAAVGFLKQMGKAKRKGFTVRSCCDTNHGLQP